jgi:hypothetical protein
MSDGTYIRFLVEPLEPLCFGSPKSFAAGEAHRLSSGFPPSPRTFQGLVRSQLLREAEPPLDLDDWSREAKDERASLVGGADALPPGWQLEGPLPARLRTLGEDDDPQVTEPWGPAPRFLLRHSRGIAHARRLVSTHPGLGDLDPGWPLLGRPDLTDTEPLGGWLGPQGLLLALAGESDGACWQDEFHGRLPPFVRGEHQPGLAIDRAGPTQGTARHGLLYFLGAHRFARDSGLLGGLQALLPSPLRRSALEAAGGTAGRKGRLVRFRAVEQFHPVWDYLIEGAHLPDRVAEGGLFWLTTLTPVFLDVPAGSAWLIQVSGGDPERRRKRLLALHDAHPLGPREEAVLGFGYTLVGLGPLSTEETP